MKLILDGLTGTGKSSTLAALRHTGLAPSLIVPEEETFGELMDELTDAPLDPAHFVRRLDAVTARLERERPEAFVLERFHLSYYAQVPDWTLYRALDERLAALGVSIVLLTVPDAALRERALRRAEYDGADWQNLAAHCGSEALALDALRRSQDLRREALARTRLPHLTVDTSAQRWDDYARTLVGWNAQQGAPWHTPTQP